MTTYDWISRLIADIGSKHSRALAARIARQAAIVRRGTTFWASRRARYQMSISRARSTMARMSASASSLSIWMSIRVSIGASAWPPDPSSGSSSTAVFGCPPPLVR